VTQRETKIGNQWKVFQKRALRVRGDILKRKLPIDVIIPDLQQIDAEVPHMGEWRVRGTSNTNLERNLKGRKRILE
jgi:hypothetical protein